MRTSLEEGQTSANHHGSNPTLHLLYSCPFCWKVRGLLEHLDVDVNYVGVNGMKIKKDVAFAGDWGKVVFTDAQGRHHVDSTPLLRLIDRTTTTEPWLHQATLLAKRRMTGWTPVEGHRSHPLRKLGSALKTTTRISKIGKFGFISKRLYAWAGFPIMGIIARKARQVAVTVEHPRNRHDLLTEFTDVEPFFGGSSPDLVDFAASATCSRYRLTRNLSN